VGVLAKFARPPTESHFSAAKTVQRNCAVLNEIQWPAVLFPTRASEQYLLQKFSGRKVKNYKTGQSLYLKNVL
jgi:hypothetical protein